MELTNEEAAWAEAKVADLIRDAVAWLLLMHISKLGVLPEP